MTPGYREAWTDHKGRWWCVQALHDDFGQRWLHIEAGKNGRALFEYCDRDIADASLAVRRLIRKLEGRI